MDKYIYIAIFCISLIVITIYTKRHNTNNKVRIACIGDSITYGSRLKFRMWNCYPNILNGILHPDFVVCNFGVSGACAIANSDKPYTKEKTYKKSLKYQPDFVLLMLGTNDSKTQNWDLKRFKSDYMAIIKKYKNLDSKPKIYLMPPIPGFESLWNIQCSVIENQLLPIVYEIAGEMDLDIIDSNSPFIDRANLTSDNIHPNNAGAKLLAKIVSKKFI